MKPLLENLQQGEAKANKPVESNTNINPTLPVTALPSEPKTLNPPSITDSTKLTAQIQKLESRQKELQNVIEGLMAKYYEVSFIALLSFFLLYSSFIYSF